MNTKGQVVAAAGLGYFLGRTYRMKLALMLAAAGAARGVPGGPAELVARTVRTLRSSPELSRLGESFRGELLDAAKAAAATSASERIDSLNNRLLTGTEDLPGAVGDATANVGGVVGDAAEHVGGAVGDAGRDAVGTVGNVGADVLSVAGLVSKRTRDAQTAGESEAGVDDEPAGKQRREGGRSAVGKPTRADVPATSAPTRRSASAVHDGPWHQEVALASVAKKADMPE